MTTQAAMIKGYTREIELTDGVYNLHLLVKEDTDIEGTFKSWCLDDRLTMKRSTLCQSMMIRRRLGLSVLLP
jgi:hypothetical protein